MRNVDESTTANTVVGVADDQRLSLTPSDGRLIPRVPKRHHRADPRHCARGQGVRGGADDQGSLGVPGHDDVGAGAVCYGLVDEGSPVSNKVRNCSSAL